MRMTSEKLSQVLSNPLRQDELRDLKEQLRQRVPLIVELETTGYEAQQDKKQSFLKDRFSVFTNIESKLQNSQKADITFKLLDNGINLLYNQADCKKIIEFFLKHENIKFDVSGCGPTNGMKQLLFAKLMEEQDPTKRQKLEARMPGMSDMLGKIQTAGWAGLKPEQVRKNEREGIKDAQQSLSAQQAEAMAREQRLAEAQRLKAEELAKSRQQIIRPQTAKQKKEYNNEYNEFKAKLAGGALASGGAVDQAKERLQAHKRKELASSLKQEARPDSAMGGSHTKVIIARRDENPNAVLQKTERPKTAAPSRGGKINPPHQTLGSTGLASLLGKGLEGVEVKQKKPKLR